MLPIAFVVLNYKAYRETIACVDSILESQGTDNFRIVIVENGSMNESAAVLREQYAENGRVDLITSDVNLGFACGMNLGITHLRNAGWDGFIVLLNNDTVITQPGWQDIVNLKYEQYHFGVLGPDIVDLDGDHNNPFWQVDLTSETVRKLIRGNRLHYVLSFFYVTPLRKLKHALIHPEKHKQPAKKPMDDLTGVALQGSCLILSPLYLEIFDGLYPKTFLYYEESVLDFRCRHSNLPMVFSPELTITHKECIASKAAYPNGRKRDLTGRKYYIASLKVIYQDVLQFEKDGIVF